MKRAAGLIVFVLALFGMALTVQAAKQPGLPGGFKNIKTYPAKLHVAGGLTITSKEDTLSNCSPGQAWTMKEDVDLVINDRVTVQYINKKLASTTFAREKGAVVQKSSISNYRSTNYCPPQAPVKLDKPRCTRNDGTGVASIGPDPRLNGTLGIGITRHGSTRQLPPCLGPSVDPSPRGTVITALQMPYMGIDLPMRARIKRLKNLEPGKSVISRIEISGPCKFAIADAHPAFSKAGLDDDCEVEGFFNVQLKRLRR